MVEQSDGPAMQAMPHLTLYAPQVASAAAVTKAQQIQVPENIATVNSSARILYFQRMPGAKYASIDIAINKSFTAAVFGLPTPVHGEQAKPSMPFV